MTAPLSRTGATRMVLPNRNSESMVRAIWSVGSIHQIGRFIPSPVFLKKHILQKYMGCLKANFCQGGRGHWAVYYTSSQS